MSDQQHQESSSENAMDRLTKKLKSDSISVNINPQTDITALAMERYDNIKQNHNFVSFEEADKTLTLLTCKTQNHSLPLHDFNQEMYRFRRNGYCVDPDSTTKGYVFGSKLKELKEKSQLQGEDIHGEHQLFMEKIYDKTTKQYKKQLTAKFRQNREKDSKEPGEYQGPWAGYGQNLQNGALTQDQKQQLSKAEETKQTKIEDAKVQQLNFQPFSKFHWDSYVDYKGISYLQAPTDYRKGPQHCYLPKKEIFSWATSQRQGFQVVRFFPKVGNFFMVGTPEGRCHLFDIVRNKTCAHSYFGHTKAVRDIQFSHSGKDFLSCGFDNKVVNWDTETGKVNVKFNLKRIPFTLKYHPSENLPNVFLCGSSSRKIYQFDLRTGTKTMEYSQHLGTVNTLTFIEQNKFVSSSDDKKLFIWQYGVPVVTRHVSEPEMHTITSTAMHPSGQYFGGQSSDNQIVIYENKGGNFRRLRAKKFASHYCAGYACAVDFSNDGQFLLSGDERGKVFCYDWKTCKVYRTLQGHAGACIGLQWHPSQPTTMVSCGWQGTVKLWQ